MHWYLPTIAALSLITFVLYYFDKKAAQRGGRRTPEQTLHLLALAGGWPGAVFAQQLFRHKSRKRRFQLIFWLCAALNTVMMLALVILSY